MKDLQLRAQMCEVGRRLWQRGLVGATEGNLSARISPQRILCTPSGLSKGHLRPADLVVIDNHGASIEGGEPSSEIKMHLRIYQVRPDCQAVVHAHPPIATGFALAGEDIPDDLLPESMVVLGSVATVPFAMPGTDEVPNALEPLLEDHKSFLLGHHGAVVLGKDLVDACYRMETLERIAQIIATAKAIGKPRPMPTRAFDKLQKYLNGKL
jgi:L-fuculose-phosphate aldolase